MYPRAQSTYLAAPGVLASVTWLIVHAPLHGRAMNVLVPLTGDAGTGIFWPASSVYGSLNKDVSPFSC